MYHKKNQFDQIFLMLNYAEKVSVLPHAYPT